MHRGRRTGRRYRRSHCLAHRPTRRPDPRAGSVPAHRSRDGSPAPVPGATRGTLPSGWSNHWPGPAMLRRRRSAGAGLVRAALTRGRPGGDAKSRPGRPARWPRPRRCGGTRQEATCRLLPETRCRAAARTRQWASGQVGTSGKGIPGRATRPRPVRAVGPSGVSGAVTDPVAWRRHQASRQRR